MNEHERSSSPSTSSPGAASGVERVRVAAELRQALATVCSASRADDVLRRALTAAGLTSAPRSAQAVRRFGEGPLIETTAAELGEAPASAVRDRLAPLVASLARIAADAERRTPDATAPEILLGVHAARVAIGVGIGADDRLALEGALPDLATEWIGVFERLEPTLQAHVAEPRTIVVECRRANPLVPRIVALDPALLDDSVLVLWGPSRIEESQTRRAFPGATVVACSREATARDVATLIRMGAA